MVVRKPTFKQLWLDFQGIVCKWGKGSLGKQEKRCLKFSEVFVTFHNWVLLSRDLVILIYPVIFSDDERIADVQSPMLHGFLRFHETILR